MMNEVESHLPGIDQLRMKVRSMHFNDVVYENL